MRSPAKIARRFWMTVFAYGSSTQVCSRHTSRASAERFAKACEKRGGAEHRLWNVSEHEIKRTPR